MNGGDNMSTWSCDVGDGEEEYENVGGEAVGLLEFLCCSTTALDTLKPMPGLDEKCGRLKSPGAE
jgi:hypothetical protein